MLSKRIQALLAILMIAVLVVPNVPASALAPLPPQATIAYHNLTGLASYMGSPADGRPIHTATAAQREQGAQQQEAGRGAARYVHPDAGTRDAPRSL